ncbi:hypothetical protein [Halobaculum marinum]|uniref:Lipoprotein n=1 Tax=Halobaculum marinum TaxID=3031996 RepID=A0ABD5WZ19_9EURY|nr:hypothetical protein [Halobaculum sp. DT55]
MASRSTRRSYLAALTSATCWSVVLAGCTGSGPAFDGDTTTGARGDATTSSAPTTTVDEPLDLREANVTAVTVDCDGRDCRFDVTLYHDDDGEAGYANWWQVETRDGERLGRRDLLHAHGTREFTRSATVTVPEGVTEVVVRGHDQTHGYGGQAMLVNVETGETTAVRQGPEPRSFAE